MSKLLVLGAGPFQVSGIKKAVALGHEVITADYTTDGIGHRFSSQRVDCSTTDIAGILGIATELEVDGICTFASDVAVPAVAHACTELELPGVPEPAARTMAFKHRFRRFQHEHGLPHPHFANGRVLEELGSIADFTWPLIVKPVDTSGSRGVIKVIEPSMDAVARAFTAAKEFSRSGMVCVEEFVRGTEVGGDAIVVDGKTAFIAITRKYLDGFVVTGHSLPAAINAHAQAMVVNALESCCVALGNITGVINFDVMVDEGRTCVLEMSPRTGGNGIPAIITHATGVDPEIATIQLALGQPIETTPARATQGAASWVFGSRSAGILQHLNGADEVRRYVPELLELHQTTPQGSTVEPFMHGGTLLGYALFECPSPNHYRSIVSRIEDALQLAVGSP